MFVLFSCAPSSDIIRFSTMKKIFNDEDVIYISNIDTSYVSFWGKNSILENKNLEQKEEYLELID